MTNVLFKTSINDIAKAATNEVSIADFTNALDVLEGNKTLYGCDDAQVLRVKALTRNIKVIGRQNGDSVYVRDACRAKMFGLVTFYSLPSLFITLNPTDIMNLLVSFWHNAGGSEAFDLDTLLPKLPDKEARKQIVAEDPVPSSEMFDTVVNSFMESFLGFEHTNVDGLVASSSTSRSSLATQSAVAFKQLSAPWSAKGEDHFIFIFWCGSLAFLRLVN
jgi:hypothetical protein